MNLTEERINHLSHLVLNALKSEGKASFAEETKVLAAIKKAIHGFGAILEVVDQLVRQKITSQKRGIPEGSREWDLLYRQYFDQELAKKGL